LKLTMSFVIDEHSQQLTDRLVSDDALSQRRVSLDPVSIAAAVLVL
jgi:hypothetical protein